MAAHNRNGAARQSKTSAMAYSNPVGRLKTLKSNCSECLFGIDRMPCARSQTVGANVTPAYPTMALTRYFKMSTQLLPGLFQGTHCSRRAMNKHGRQVEKTRPPIVSDRWNTPCYVHMN